MRLVFTKGSGKSDRLEVFTSTPQPVTIECPKQRIIPHDMMHFAVESTLMVRGFLTRIQEGERAVFQMQGNDQSDAVERLVEVFQGDEWSGRKTEARHMLEMYTLTCSARGCPTMSIDEAAILEVRDSIAQLTSRWETVPIGGKLELHFPSVPRAAGARQGSCRLIYAASGCIGSALE